MLVGVVGAAAVAGIAYAWFPHDGNYRPIEASERGTLSDIIYALRVESTEGARTVRDATRPSPPRAAGRRTTRHHADVVGHRDPAPTRTRHSSR